MAKKNDVEKSKRCLKKLDILKTRAHLIEASTESSLQPLLQTYLLFVGMHGMSWSLINVFTNHLDQLIQLFSLATSVLSISWSFTNNYDMKMERMMTFRAKGAYFLMVLLSVLSRILCLELFAIPSWK